MIQKKIDTLKQEVASMQQELKDLELAVNTLFPDLREETARFSRKYLVSDRVNVWATKAVFSRSCGCCDDANHQVSFCLEYGSLTIYGQPRSFVLASYSDFGMVPEENLEVWNEMVKAGITEPLIEECRVHLQTILQEAAQRVAELEAEDSDY